MAYERLIGGKYRKLLQKKQIFLLFFIILSFFDTTFCYETAIYFPISGFVIRPHRLREKHSKRGTGRQETRNR